jgi:ribosomal-protein-alanine N-acetyltransferase
MLKDDVIKIAPLTAEHTADAAGLERVCFSSPRSEAALKEELNDPCYRHFAAFCGAVFAGYIGLYIVAGEAYVTDVAVLPEHRRKGVGDALVKQAVKQADGEGCEFITLEVRVSNEAAASLYANNGFETVGRRKDFYSHPREDAVIMTLRFVRTEKKDQ